ncbi:MAG TPA: VWA domain-containing protein [Candidatus Hydrogenedentes bacterium]|nr:VWA domain-containing protein [Candidatus Hydrogenedentota bacterium]HIJ74971.1 VWA domain-containing protein [Candidatus Hydrogenedentota bacterium]
MSPISAFRFNALTDPWAFLLLLAVLALLLVEIAVRPPGTLLVSTGETLARVRRHRHALLRRLPAILRALGLTLLVIALARPLKGHQLRKDIANVKDIMLCVDVSGSMSAEDFTSGNQLQTRLAVTKEAVRDFIQSRKDRPSDRYGLDRLGLILYAGYAWTQCPLTLDYGLLEREIELARIDTENPKKRGTAIGSALGLAVSRLRDSEAKTKLIILLTDGQNNRGELDPTTAAQFAKEYGIRIYTIGAGAKDEVMMPQQTLFGVIRTAVYSPIDEQTLRKIAEIGDGKFYRATDTASLQAAYAEINELETTEIEIADYYEYEEGFVPYASAGTLALLASVFGRRRWFEAIP